MFLGSDTGSPAGSPAATAVFAAVLTEGPVSRVSLARRLGLSSAAVTKAARPLIDLGYLHELAATERTGPGAGRPASPLAVRADREFFLGVKITADELIGVVCDLRAQVRTTARRPLTDPDVEAVLTEVGRLADDLLIAFSGDRTRVRRLGLALSGDVDRTTGLVRYSPFLHWRDVPLGRLAAERTGFAVTVENDVKALTAAEHWFGEGSARTRSPWSPWAPASAAAWSSTVDSSPARTAWPARSATSPWTPPARTATAVAVAASRRSPAPTPSWRRPGTTPAAPT
ncbi:hypothetical protein GCM10027614_02510 [Micromonospora vulcania]